MHLHTHPVSATPAAVSPTAPRCGNRRVGVLLEDEDGCLLMLRSAAGLTGLTGHGDEHSEPAEAAHALVADTLGLTLTGLELVVATWRGDRCERLSKVSGIIGHTWYLYRAQVSTDALAEALSAEQLRDAHRYTGEQLQLLAMHTALYAADRLTDAEFLDRQGIAPVWVDWLVEAGLVKMGEPERAAIDWAGIRTSAPAPMMAWQQAYPDQAWHRAPAPLPVTSRQVPARLQRLEEAGAADLVAEADAARMELARTDTKAGLLLGFAGTAFSVLAALGVLASGLLPAGRVGLGIAVALLAAASAVALTVIRPSLPHPATGTGTGFIAHARVGDAEELLACLAEDPEMRRAQDVVRLSQIAAAKYRRLRVATDLMLLALAVVIVSLPSLL
ncbi:Pycsar system effector family protein [Streptosporangium sp. NPDC000509]|uniref:Pycsar system effector family protein n=1 Tax=Streptosporangium sp. NPDC000509 TaxID=3366186 RepID=UPI0036C703BF